MDDTPLPNYTDPINILAAVFIFVNGIMGTVTNLLIIYIFIKSPTERTSFNVICVFRGIGNTIILTWGFLATFLPITLIGASPFSPFYETLVIGFSNSLYSGLQYTGVYIALNRFCAMFFPTYYPKIFDFKITFLITLLMFIYRFVKIILEFFHYIPLECWMVYTSYDLAWSPNMGEQCKDDDNSSNINTSAIFQTVLVILNAAIFAKIYFFYKSTDLSTKGRKRKLKKNKVLFLQTMIQDSITLIDMIFTFRLSLLSTKRLWSFFCGTVIWECLHSIDGLIMVMFNERLTFLQKTFFASSTNASVASKEKGTATVTPMKVPSPVV